MYNPIHEDDFVAHISRLLEIADVPAVTVNWGGSDQASVEERCAYLSELTGLDHKIVLDENICTVSDSIPSTDVRPARQVQPV